VWRYGANKWVAVMDYAYPGYVRYGTDGINFDDVISPGTGNLANSAGSRNGSTWNGSVFAVLDYPAPPNYTQQGIILHYTDDPSSANGWTTVTVKSSADSYQGIIGSRTTDGLMVVAHARMKPGEPGIWFSSDNAATWQASPVLPSAPSDAVDGYMYPTHILWADAIWVIFVEYELPGSIWKSGFLYSKDALRWEANWGGVLASGPIPNGASAFILDSCTDGAGTFLFVGSTTNYVNVLGY
jgi:hypothetical protein